MNISNEQVQHVAALARLKLTETETDQFTNQLNKILQFAEKLNELDTTDTPPTAQVFAMENVMRADQVQISLDPEQVLLNAPDQQDGMFKVPAVFDE